MQELTSGPEPLRVVGPAQNVSLAKLEATSHAKYKIPEKLPVNAAPSMQGDLLTTEQELLMVEHLPIVRFIARRIHERLPQHVPIEDLYSAGVVGLLDTFGKFDPSKQVQFRSYAQFRIRGAILDSLRTLDWSPRELRRKGRAIEQAIHSLTAQLGAYSERHRDRPTTPHRSGSLPAVGGGTEGPRNRHPAFRTV
jgi:RNA polymerase sigma factor (sigma-70 family)